MNRDEVQNNALSILKANRRCGLGISMGVGKTRIALKHMLGHYNSMAEFLVVVPKHSVTQSWIDECSKMGCEDILTHITFVTYRSINKKNPDDYDSVYLDECHNLLDSHRPFLSRFRGIIVGLTGTPPARTGSEKERMVEQFCPIKFKFSVDDATDSKILNDYRIIVHNLKLSGIPDFAKKNKKTGGIWYTSEKRDYDYKTKRFMEAVKPKDKQFASIMRMRSIMEYNTKESYVKSLLSRSKNKCIVFANTQKQADRLCQYSYHSSNTNSDYNLELFSDGRIDKLSCVLQLSEGVTIPGLKSGIIMHSYGNNRKTSQRIGRLLRLNPDETATCHILCYYETVDKNWVKRALKSFDKSKIKFYNPLKKQYEMEFDKVV